MEGPRLETSNPAFYGTMESGAPVLRMTPETAAGLAQGTLNAQRALTSGRLKLRGEVDRLAAASGALAGLGDMLGPLRADTEF